MRGCYHDPRTGLGIFGILPIITEELDAAPDASVGLRYSTSKASLGGVVNPFSGSVNQIWAVRSSCPSPCADKIWAPMADHLLLTRQLQWGQYQVPAQL